MPKPGFKSITVSDDTYNYFDKVYTCNKEKLEKRNITSLSGYISSMINAELERHRAPKPPLTRIEMIEMDPSKITVIIKDDIAHEIINVVVRPGSVHCTRCDSDTCLHVGLTYAEPQIYPILEQPAVKTAPDYFVSFNCKAAQHKQCQGGGVRSPPCHCPCHARRVDNPVLNAYCNNGQHNRCKGGAYDRKKKTAVDCECDCHKGAAK